VLPEFDEYQGEAVLEHSLPGLMENDQSIRALPRPRLTRPPTQLGGGPLFKSCSKPSLANGCAARFVRQVSETWLEFCSRVNSGLAKFLAAGSRGERVAIFTSGGPIAVAMPACFAAFSGEHFTSELDVAELFLE